MAEVDLDVGGQGIRAELVALVERHGADAVSSAMLGLLQESLASESDEHALVQMLQRNARDASALVDALASIHDVDGAVQALRENAEHISDFFERFLDLIEDAPPEAAVRAAELLDAITDMQSLSQTIARVSREARYLDVAQATPCALHEVLDVGVRMYARRSPVPVVLEPPPRVTVRAPAHAMLRVLLNLLGNARESTEASGFDGRTIQVRSWASTTTAFVSVTDEGVGFKEADQDALMKPFQSTKVGSSGLGLSAVQRLVHGWGGTLRFESEEGRGSTITFGVPLP